MSEPQTHRFNVVHRSEFYYSKAARGSVMLVRLQPRAELGQRLLNFKLDIDPLAAPVNLDDAFGNTCHLFNLHREHRHTTVTARSQVESFTLPSPPEQLPTDAWTELQNLAKPAVYWEFLTPSQFARPAAHLEDFIREVGISQGTDPLTALLDMSHTLHRVLTYKPGSTAVDSPIEDILRSRQGVCQDYVHLMLTIARGWGIPARYVSGYMHLEKRKREQSVEGASHAWAEFLLPEIGWFGIDPTNDSLADHRHVRVAIGRDYADIAPTRGAVFGGGKTKLDVVVTVTEADEVPPSTPPRREYANVHNVAPLPHVPKVQSDQ